MRIGLGIDTHQLIPGKLIRLGGVDIPSDVSIKAHSDGDIIYHAIADSILGAIGAGDIGDHFPDTDPKNKDLDSEVIVRLAIEKALSMNLILNNLDITLLLESPKISDYKDKIKNRLASIFGHVTKDYYEQQAAAMQPPPMSDDDDKHISFEKNMFAIQDKISNFGFDLIDNNIINIKASTSESLGFIGKGQGVTCYCITSLRDF